MRQLLALIILCMVAARLVEASLASTHPLSVLAPGAIGALAASMASVLYMFRDE